MRILTMRSKILKTAYRPRERAFSLFLSVSLGLGSLLLPSCAFSDLRTPELLRCMESPKNRQKAAQLGRALLNRAMDAAGGQKRWESFCSAEMRLEDEWQGFLGWLFRPWPSNPTHLRMRYGRGNVWVEAMYTKGPDRGRVFGVDSHGFWFKKKGERSRRYASNESLRFILRAYQFFFELPFELAKAEIILYAGNRTRAGRVYDLVFVTWGKEAPHAEADQYLCWIPRDSHRLEMVQYTLRDKFDFAKGCNRFSDFRKVQGMVLPFAYWIAQNPDDPSFIHRVQIEDVFLFHH